MATMVKKLQKSLRKGIVKFQFIKNDGTLRTAQGTMNEEIIKTLYDYRGGQGPERYGYTTYWDVEKGGFRCFDERRLVAIL